MKRVAMACLVSLTAGSSLWAQTSQPATVEAVGLSIHRELPGKGEMDEFAQQASTEVKLKVSAPGSHVLSVDEAGCMLTSFVDDKGTVLGKPGPAGGFGPERWLGFMPRISKDGQDVLVQVRSPRVPAADATAVLIKARLSLLRGAAEKTAEQKDVELKEGAKVTAGPVAMTVKEVKPGLEGDKESAQMVTLTGSASAANLAKIKSISFVGADGKEIAARRASYSRFGDDRKMEFEDDYSLGAKAEKVTVKVTYFDKVEKLAVPVDLRVGLGVGAKAAAASAAGETTRPSGTPAPSRAVP